MINVSRHCLSSTIRKTTLNSALTSAIVLLCKQIPQDSLLPFLTFTALTKQVKCQHCDSLQNYKHKQQSNEGFSTVYDFIYLLLLLL